MRLLPLTHGRYVLIVIPLHMDATCNGENDMHSAIITAVLHGIYSACAGVIVVLIAIAWVKYRAYR